MTIDEALNTLAKKFAYSDDIKEMGNYYIKECKNTLLKIILGEKPKKKRKGKYWTAMQIQGFNQCTDEYEKKITALFNREA